MAIKTEKKYDALVVDADMDSRIRLKQAMSSVYNFGKITQVVDPQEAIFKLKSGDAFDVIFISYRIDKAHVTQFIKEAKETKPGQDAAYVLVLQGKDQDASTVAQNVMIGADGFLFEPYSVDLLVEMTRISARVKAERSVAREKTALAMMVHEVVGQIDQLSYIKSCKMEVGMAMKKFRDTCAMFKDLDPEKMATYLEIAMRTFEEAPVPKQIFQTKKYAGVSNRIRQKMEQKILAEIEKKEAEQKKSE